MTNIRIIYKLHRFNFSILIYRNSSITTNFSYRIYILKRIKNICIQNIKRSLIK